jgi:hypothetical protein
MNFKLTRGCVCDSLTVDGKEFVDLSLEEVKSLVINILQKEPEDMLIREILEMIITYRGEEKNWYRCDCCNDIVESYELDIDLS